MAYIIETHESSDQEEFLRDLQGSVVDFLEGSSITPKVTIHPERPNFANARLGGRTHVLCAYDHNSPKAFLDDFAGYSLVLNHSFDKNNCPLDSYLTDLLMENGVVPNNHLQIDPSGQMFYRPKQPRKGELKEFAQKLIEINGVKEIVTSFGVPGFPWYELESARNGSIDVPNQRASLKLLNPI